MILSCQPLLKRRIPNIYITLYSWSLFLHLMLVKNVGEMMVNQNTFIICILVAVNEEHTAHWKEKCVCTRWVAQVTESLVPWLVLLLDSDTKCNSTEPIHKFDLILAKVL